MNRKLLNRKPFLLGVLLCCLALPLGHLAAQDDAAPDVSAPDAADFLPDEPNDTFATATPLSDFWDIADLYYYSYQRDGYFLTAADVDYYAFQSDAIYFDSAGVWVSADIDPRTDDTPTTLRVELALFDAAYNLVAEDAACESGGASVWKPNAPAGNYFVRVRPCAGTHDANQPYEMDANMIVPYDVAEVEPNDTPAQATPIAYGQMVGGAFEDSYPCDEDWFRFEGRAGDRMPDWFMSWLTDANGNDIRSDVLPADGVYYLLISARDPDDPGCQVVYDYRFRLGEKALWVSASADGLGGNAAIKRGDIATRKTAANQWAIVFDASDVGITKDVVAFHRLPNGSLLLSLGATQNVPGLGKVTPQDIIRFVPTSLGANTAGMFEWYLDGSDVGLTTAGEKIDAIYWRDDVIQPLHISIAGAGSVPRQSGGNLVVADEDTINFVADSYGANSAGKWRMTLDGSDRPGMAAEDVNALEYIDGYPASQAFIVWTLTDAFNLEGVTGGPMDVLLDQDHMPLGAFRMTDKPIDGLAVGPAWLP